MTNQTLTAIIPAAGVGARTGLEANKLLHPVAGHSVIWWTLHALAEAKVLLADVGFGWDDCVIAARRQEFNLLEDVLATIKLPFEVRLVEGGANRQKSVQNAVQATSADWVMVHDGARPLVSATLCAAVCQAALSHGGAIAALRASDTVKSAVVSNGQPMIKSTFERSEIWLAQTPQVFTRRYFLRALESAQQDGFEGTDCASLMEHTGQSVALVTGESQNFKITYPEDLMRAELLLKNSR